MALNGGGGSHQRSAVAPSANRDRRRHAHMEIKGWRSLRPSPSHPDEGRQARRQNSKDLKIQSDLSPLAAPRYGHRWTKGPRRGQEYKRRKRAREDQLIAALDHRNEARRVAEDRSGETAAKERFNQLLDEKDAAYERVSNTRARTLSGVLAKLALIASDFDDESASELPAEMGMSPEPILFSVAVDFKELKAWLALSGENANV